jgi:carbon monoxide dehydrogenase subunit G
MELEHQFIVPASIEVTWAAFNDPGRVAPCFPGATLISVEGDEFTGSAKVKLGPIALQYNGTGRYVERDESAHRAVIEAKGKDKRGNGTANATVTAQLTASGDATSVHVTTDLAVTGKPAQFGRGVMQDVSDKLLEQFVTCLQATLGEAAPVSAPESQPDAPAQVAQTAQPGPSGQPGPSAQPAPPGGGAASVPGAPAYRPSLHAAPAADVELNLLRTVGGVLLTRYAARALGPLAFIVGYWLGRRSRR